ncbi:hypothetical protein DY000_02010939 [Brassica cretica]|nr:hypothetical protein DY000_02010939 [Brassica cretica]
MATSPSDKLVEEQEVGTEEVVDPAKTTDEEDEARTEVDEVRTEVDEVRTEEVDPAKTTEEEDEVRTEVDEVRTEEVDPAKTTEEEDEVRTEEDEVRTEEVDPPKTTEEEDKARTEEEEVRTEEVDHTKTTEKEDEVRAEEDKARTEEDEVRTEEEDEHKEEAIESLLDSTRNLNIEDEESNQGTENQNRQEDPITIPRSDQTMERGSTSLASDQNRRLDSDPNTSAISLSVQDQGTENQNPQEQSMSMHIVSVSLCFALFLVPQLMLAAVIKVYAYRLCFALFHSVSCPTINVGLGLDVVLLLLSTDPSLDQTRRSGQRMERGSTSSSRDQNQNRPLVLPSQQMMMPRLGPSVPPYQQNPFGLPQPRWLVVDHFYSDGLGLYGALWRFRTITPFLPNQNTHPHQLVPMELPGQPGTELVCYSQSFGVLRQGQLVPHHEAPPMRPQQNQFRRLPPMRPMLPQDDFVVHLGQVPVRPMMYYQEQNQIIPNAGISQPPLRPGLPQLGAPMMQPPVLLYPPPIVNAVPVRPVMNQGGQRFRFPMIQQHQGSPSAPWPEQNQQLQSPRESQGSNDGPFSSGGSQD